MLGWLSLIPGLLGQIFGSIASVSNALSDARIAQINATTEQERIVIQERITALQAKRDILIAEAPYSRANIYMRSGAGLAVILVLWKLFVWDKVIGSFAGCSQALAGTCKIFTTDAFDDNQWTVIMIVIGFYFSYEIGMGVAKALKG